jgi:hypothetical protein
LSSPIIPQISSTIYNVWLTEKANPHFLELLEEVIDAVFDQLDDLRDFGSLRLTCEYIGRCVVGRDQRTRLVRKMSFMPSIRSVNRLHQVAHNMFTDYPLGTSDCIERVVFEDVYPIATRSCPTVQLARLSGHDIR